MRLGKCLGTILEALLVSSFHGAGGSSARRRRLCFASPLLLFTLFSVYVRSLEDTSLPFPCLAPTSTEMSLMGFSDGLDTIGTVCFSGGSRFTSRSSVSSPRRSLSLGSLFVLCRSANLVSINVTQKFPHEDLRRNSSSLPPQVLLPPLTTGDRTSFVCGVPRLTRRSDLENFGLTWTSSSLFTTTNSIPASSRFGSFYCGSGEIRRADIIAAPSPIGGAVSLVDSGEIIAPTSDALCLVTGVYPSNSGMNRKLLNFPISWLFISKPRRISGGFTGAFNLRKMPNLSYKKKSLLLPHPRGLVFNVTICDYFYAIRLCRECYLDAFKLCLESAVIFD
ncbi:hypothetical protein Bca4012_019107 [Brassica carinata]